MINLQKLMNTSKVQQFSKGTVIIRESDTDTDSMYIVLKGRVGVYKNLNEPNMIKLASLNSGSFFGEMSLFLNHGRTADVVADEDVTALRIYRHNAYEFFESQPEATYSLIRTLCSRIEGQNKHLTEHNISTEEIRAVVTLPEEERNGLGAPSLFPPGHGSYSYKIKPPEPDAVYPKQYQCPFCLHTFKKQIPRQSALKPVKTDVDLRVYYKGFEPLHFEIISCPMCYLSAVTSLFDKAQTSKESVLFEILSPYQGKYNLTGEAVTDINSMFIGMYLAELCAPVCFPNKIAVSARIWHRISWLYGDCGDAEMRAYAEDKALNLYTRAYQEATLPEDQVIRVQLIIAELSFRAKDMKTAAEFFIKVKSNKQAGSIYQRLAEDRIIEIRRK